MTSKYKEIVKGPWTVRAILYKNLEVLNWPGHNDDDEPIKKNIWVWYYSRTGEDVWFAHGASDAISREIFNQVHATLDGAEMDVMLSYGGENWDMVEPNNTVAEMQRRLLGTIGPRKMAKLLSMSRSEIEALRRKEEIAHMESIDPSNN